MPNPYSDYDRPPEDFVMEALSAMEPDYWDKYWKDPESFDKWLESIGDEGWFYLINLYRNFFCQREKRLYELGLIKRGIDVEDYCAKLWKSEWGPAPKYSSKVLAKRGTRTNAFDTNPLDENDLIPASFLSDLAASVPPYYANFIAGDTTMLERTGMSRGDYERLLVAIYHCQRIMYRRLLLGNEQGGASVGVRNKFDQEFYRILGSRKSQLSELEDKIEGTGMAASPPPTAAQIEAGNYRKGQIRLHGMAIAIENPRGSYRTGTDREGISWRIKMRHHYGYIRGTVGRDKDHVDVFLGPDPTIPYAFIIDQIDPATGRFDEHKVMLGFESTATAKEGYLSNYSAGWRGLGAITAVSLDDLKEWLSGGPKGIAYSAHIGRFSTGGRSAPPKTPGNREPSAPDLNIWAYEREHYPDDTGGVSGAQKSGDWVTNHCSKIWNPAWGKAPKYSSRVLARKGEKGGSENPLKPGDWIPISFWGDLEQSSPPYYGNLMRGDRSMLKKTGLTDTQFQQLLIELYYCQRVLYQQLIAERDLMLPVRAAPGTVFGQALKNGFQNSLNADGSNNGVIEQDVSMAVSASVWKPFWGEVPAWPDDVLIVQGTRSGGWYGSQGGENPYLRGDLVPEGWFELALTNVEPSRYMDIGAMSEHTGLSREEYISVLCHQYLRARARRIGSGQASYRRSPESGVTGAASTGREWMAAGTTAGTVKHNGVELQVLGVRSVERRNVLDKLFV